MNTREIIEKYFECINNQDWETWLTLFDDNVLMDEALSGHIEGMQAMRDSAKGIQQQFSRSENHIQEIVVEGNKGMVVCCIEAVTAGGASTESTGANFYRVENVKILYMSSFHNSAPFAKAFSGVQ
jgi:ketosteroid isomerase-like protein